jgi:hypothetical protein
MTNVIVTAMIQSYATMRLIGANSLSQVNLSVFKRVVIYLILV